MWGMTFEKSLRLFWPRPVAETDARGSSEGRTPRRSRRADAPQTHNREAEMNADKTIQITATEHLITLGIVVGLGVRRALPVTRTYCSRSRTHRLPYQRTAHPRPAPVLYKGSA